MSDLLEDDQHVRAAVNTLRCPECGACRGLGLIIARITALGEGHVQIVARCLRDGVAFQVTIRTHLAKEPTVSRPKPAPVSGDEVLDVREALQQSDWWSELVKPAT